MKVCEYQVRTPIELRKRIGIIVDDLILDPNLVWRGDFERDGFLSCTEKANRIIPENLKELLTFADDPIDLLNDSYGLYLFLQKVGVDKTIEGFDFLKEIGLDGVSIPEIPEIPWITDEKKLTVEVGLALMTSGEGTNFDTEKAGDHLFALNLYQKFGDLITYGKYWITVDDFEDHPKLKLCVSKNETPLVELTLSGYLDELKESVRARSKKGWIHPGDIFILKSSQKMIEVLPGDLIEQNIVNIMNIKNSLGTPSVGKPWEI